MSAALPPLLEQADEEALAAPLWEGLSLSPSGQDERATGAPRVVAAVGRVRGSPAWSYKIVGRGHLSYEIVGVA